MAQQMGDSFNDNLVHSDHTSFNKIYNLYYKKAFLFAKSYVQKDDVAEDIASESLMKLWQVLRTQEPSRTEPLLLTILKNKALDYLRHESVEKRAMSNIKSWKEEEVALRITSLEACNPEDIFSEEIRRIVAETLRALPEQTRRVFIKSRYEHKSNPEIAGILGISVKGVEYHITKALKILRVALKDFLPIFYFLFYYQ